MMPFADGEFVTETFKYDEGRQVTVYVPPERPEAVVFAGDGQELTRWGVDLEAADMPPTLIVGVHRRADETLRLQEYSPSFDPQRFTAHEAFFVDEVRRWTTSRFGVAVPAERTAVLASRPAGSWRWLWDSVTRTPTAPYSAPRRARGSDRLR